MWIGHGNDPMEKFRKGADFLFGVLIAVALGDAFEGFLHISLHEWIADPASPASGFSPQDYAPWCLALWRLIVFASMVANFYFGSIKYFDKTYSNTPSTDTKFGTRFTADFFSGLVHFALFFMWSLSISAPLKSLLASRCFYLSFFSLMLMIVLIYDLIWWCLRRLVTLISKSDPWNAPDSSTHKQIWQWTWHDLLVTAAILVILAVGTRIWPGQPGLIEAIAATPALLWCLWEFPKNVSD
jgi:hypothetical protein